MEPIVLHLRRSRSVEATALALNLPLPTVQRAAFMAFGLGELEVPLADF
jgi:hypothetical protein